jgi:hypothetical protein
MKGGLMGERCLTQLNGKTVKVTVVQIEQNINHRGYGKWLCVNDLTGRPLHRTARQLHPIPSNTPNERTHT